MGATARRLLSIDARSLALFRILLALILLTDLAIRSQDLTAHYTDKGVLPRDLARADAGAWSGYCGGFPIYFLSGVARGQIVWMSVAAVAAMLLAVGCFTPLVTAASWLLLCSLHGRNPLVLNGGDDLLRMLLFWSIFLPLGRVGSVDASRWGKTGRNAVCSVATCAVLLQICLMYWMTVWFKLGDAAWREGSALLQTLSFDAYARPLAVRMRQWPAPLVWLNYGTLALQVFGPLLLFVPYKTTWFRTAVICAMTALHIAIELTLTVGLFSYVAISAWILVLPAEVWDRLTGASSAPVAGQQQAAPGAIRGFPRIGKQALCAAALVYVVLANVRSTGQAPLVRDWLQPLGNWGYRLGLDQHWAMFRHAAREDGWHVARADLTDGWQVDLVRSGAEVDWEKPENPAGLYPNHRWRKLMQMIIDQKHRAVRAPLCRWLVDRWEAAGGASCRRLQLYLVRETIDEGGESADGGRLLLHQEVFISGGNFDDARRELQQNATELAPGI